MEGKNVADFIDPDIEAKLDALELEEEKLIASGFYQSEDEMVRFLVLIKQDDDGNEAIEEAAAEIKAKKDAIVAAHRISRGKNRPSIPQKVKALVIYYILIERNPL